MPIPVGILWEQIIELISIFYILDINLLYPSHHL